MSNKIMQMPLKVVTGKAPKREDAAIKMPLTVVRGDAPRSDEVGVKFTKSSEQETGVEAEVQVPKEKIEEIKGQSIPQGEFEDACYLAGGYPNQGSCNILVE